MATVLQEFSRTNERSVFWNDDLKKNVDPFAGSDYDFWTMDWDTKVRLRYRWNLDALYIRTPVSVLAAQDTPPVGRIAALPQHRNQGSH